MKPVQLPIDGKALGLRDDVTPKKLSLAGEFQGKLYLEHEVAKNSRNELTDDKEQTDKNVQQQTNAE